MQNQFNVPNSQRNGWIDCFRGFCLLAVVCTHGLFELPAGVTNYPWYTSTFIDKGYFGVAAFFVISGFLITGNTLRRYGEPAKIDFGQFYAMRAARILPCLFLFFLIMVPIGYSNLPLFSPADKELLWSSLYAALTLQYNSHYFLANAPGLHHWSPLWSLSIEELFYLTFPLICFLAWRRAVFVSILAGLIVLGPFVRKEFAGVFNFWGAADLLALGCLAALATDRFRPSVARFSRSLQIIGAAIILPVFAFGQVRANHMLAPTLLGLGAALFLMGAATNPSARAPKLAEPLAALGRVSYEIYVFHSALILALKPVTLAVLGYLGGPPIFTHCAMSVIVLAVIYRTCAAISHFVTEPLNAHIRRFYSTPRLLRT